MSTMYVCKNCQEHYYPPKRKDGICKTCSNAVATAKEAVKSQLAANITKLQEQAESDMAAASRSALLKRYKPPSTNDHLRIAK